MEINYWTVNFGKIIKIKMNIAIENIIEALKIIAGVAVFFVWVVRYENIKKEFVQYKIPDG